MVVPTAPVATTKLPEPGGQRVPWARLAAGVAVLGVAVYLPFYFTPEVNTTLSQVLYLAVAAVGLNLLTGYNGQVSIGHGAFFGIGAFTSAVLVVNHGWQFEYTIPVAALLAAGLGVMVGFPALRVRGLYLALITLGLAVVFPRVTAKVVKGTGGVALVRPSRADLTSLLSGLADDQYQYLLCLLLLCIVLLLTWNLMRSRAGRAIIATRDHEVAAEAVGINVAAVKVGTFALSAAFAGVAGSMSVLVDHLADATNPITYFQLSIEFLIAVVIGGSATIIGPVVGAALLVLLRKQTAGLITGKEILAPAVLGGALILIVYVLPDGAVGGFRRLVARLGRGRRRPSSTPDPPPDAPASLTNRTT
ncbi:MAG: transporter permease [Acidimicrobiales bacterium]|nr:transporter permease [Acidimicrobiales bacterium]